jgi:hypothetical protein
MQADPLGYAAGMNLYAYVGADPVNQTDPSGMFSVCTPYRTRVVGVSYGADGGVTATLGRFRTCIDSDRLFQGGIIAAENTRGWVTSKVEGILQWGARNNRACASSQDGGAIKALGLGADAQGAISDMAVGILEAGSAVSAAKRVATVFMPLELGLGGAAALVGGAADLKAGLPADVVLAQRGAPLAAGVVVGGAAGAAAGAALSPAGGVASVAGGVTAGYVGGKVGEMGGSLGGKGYAMVRGYGECR